MAGHVLPRAIAHSHQGVPKQQVHQPHLQGQGGSRSRSSAGTARVEGLRWRRQGSGSRTGCGLRQARCGSYSDSIYYSSESIYYCSSHNHLAAEVVEPHVPRRHAGHDVPIMGEPPVHLQASRVPPPGPVSAEAAVLAAASHAAVLAAAPQVAQFPGCLDSQAPCGHTSTGPGTPPTHPPTHPTPATHPETHPPTTSPTHRAPPTLICCSYHCAKMALPTRGEPKVYRRTSGAPRFRRMSSAHSVASAAPRLRRGEGGQAVGRSRQWETGGCVGEVRSRQPADSCPLTYTTPTAPPQPTPNAPPRTRPQPPARSPTYALTRRQWTWGAAPAAPSLPP